MFADDVEQGAPARTGVVVGMPKGKVNVELDDPAIPVKVYQGHLEAQLGRELRLTKDEARLVEADGGRRVVTVGDRVHLRVLGPDEKTDRWMLGLERID